MRLKYGYYIVADAHKLLEDSIYEKTSTLNVLLGRKQYYIYNYEKVISALEKLEEISTLKSYANDLLKLIADEDELKYDLYCDDDDDDDEYYEERYIYTESASENLFRRSLNRLKNRIASIIDFCDEFSLNSKHCGFDVKMPPTEDFEEFADDINKLSKVIYTCPYLISETEKITLKKTDIGSIWFEFAVNGAIVSGVLLNFAVLIDKCIKIVSHKKILKQQEEEYRAANLKNELLDDLIKNNKKITDALVDAQIEALREELSDIELKGDDLERVRFSLNTIVTLMDKGMEIYASIDSPKEIKDVFPTSDKLAFLPAQKKQLEEKNN